jgi:hypothetical protein
MSGDVISIRGVVLQGFEVPERIVVSGGQRIAIHDLIGGGRVIDALGANAGAIEFGGTFSGDDAAVRAQILDAATALGVQVPLYWNSFFYMAVIEKFKFDFEKPWWIPFSLRCAVTLDPAALVAGLVNSITNSVAADVLSAVSLAPQAGLSLGLSATPSLTSLTSAQNAASAALGAADSNLASQTAGLHALTDPALAGPVVSGLVASAGRLAAISCVGGYLQRASINMANELL